MAAQSPYAMEGLAALDNSWLPNFSPSSLERSEKRKAPCEINGCEAPSVMKSGLCWSHRQASPTS